MSTSLRRSVVALVLLCGAAIPSHALEKYNILMTGYYDGPSVAGAIGLGEAFDKVPLGFELGLGYSWTRTGDPILASQVFINQNQVGQTDTQSSGGVLDLSINATYPLAKKYGSAKFVAFGGPRYARWDVRHEYTNNNEDFDVVAHVWGLGGGVRGVLPLSKNFSAILQVELNYYLRSSIYGHDATYYPDGSAINPRTNGRGYTYTYDDALRATTVPHIRPRAMIGIQF